MTVAIFTPTTLFFCIVFIGYLIGKIKIYKMSLDLTAILIVAVITGFFISKFCISVDKNEINTAMNLFSKLGTNLFIAAIGLSSGNAITKDSGKKMIKYSGMGVFMVCIGFGVAKIIGLIDQTINITLLKGILCGALTSTPGLTSVCEITHNEADLATMGYSAAYLFGVFGVVVFVQILMKQVRCPKKEELVTKDILRPDGMENLAIICLAVIVGYIVGGYEIPSMNFSLGNAGGILISAIMVGMIAKTYMKHVSICNGSLAVYRNFGLILFFLGTGVSSGGKINYLLDIKWFIYGALITVVTMLLGFAICHYFLRMNIEECILIIAGGMTSTPAMGVIMKNSDVSTDMSVYSATYLGAMITMVFGIRYFL